jgi:hypothetical protein
MRGIRAMAAVDATGALLVFPGTAFGSVYLGVCEGHAKRS